MAFAKQDLIVIGAGTAGITALTEALALGVGHITLIDRETELGGECANFACVPTKALLTGMRHLKRIREKAPLYGISIPEKQIHIDFAALSQKVTDVIGKDDYDFMRDPRMSILHGNAQFLNLNGAGHTVRVNDLVLEAPHVIVATGTSPKIPEIAGLSASGYWTFRDASRAKTLPKSMIILGAGPVGVEFAQIFQNLGVAVTLVSNSPGILPKEEPELAEMLSETLAADGVEILGNLQAVSAQGENGRQLALTLQDKSGNSIVKTAEILLLATGTTPNIADLNLDAIGVTSNVKTGITVNAEMETSIPGIWAVGDVTGPYRFTHSADYQAVIAVFNAFLNAHRTVDYHAIPWGIYTEPSLAHVGLTEALARKDFPNLTIITAQANEVTRNRIESESVGMVKLIIDQDTDMLVGGHLLAPDAEDMAHFLLLAIQQRIPVSALRNLMFIYPSKAQLIQKALDKLPIE